MRELPSAKHARALVKGKRGSTAPVVFDWVLRAALIGTGLRVAGDRHPDLLRRSLGASAAVELFVLGWMAAE